MLTLMKRTNSLFYIFYCHETTLYDAGKCVLIERGTYFVNKFIKFSISSEKNSAIISCRNVTNRHVVNVDLEENHIFFKLEWTLK